MNEAEQPVRRNRVRRFFVRLMLLVVVPLIALVFATHFYFKGGRYVTTENAYVKSHIVAISTDIDGRVVEVNVSDNQRVEAGDLLFRIDPKPFALRVAEAEAEMAMARQEIESLRADFRESRIAIAQERENVRFFTTKFERQQQLRDNGAGSVNAFDEAQHNLQIAKQRVAVLDERARQALARLGGDSGSEVEQHPSWVRAKTRRDQAAVAMQATSVYAPSAGVVSNFRLQIGEYVNTGIPVFSILETDRVWVQANLKETQLTHLQNGQAATLIVDAYPQHEWQATVASIAPATGAEFALLPPQNATGNWVKIVQRIPVELQVKSPQDAPTLRAGMTVSVKIDTNHQRQPPALIRAGLASDLLPNQLRYAMYRVFALKAPFVNSTDSQHQPVNADAADTYTDTGQITTSFDKATARTAPSASMAAVRSGEDAVPALNNSFYERLQLSADEKPTEATRGEAGNTAERETDKSIYQINFGEIKREQWLAQLPEDQFTIQLSSSDNLPFLQRFAKSLPPDTPAVIYHYKYNNNRQPEYGLASGLFESRASANQAVDKLPPAVLRNGPWVRRIGDVQRTLIVQ